WRLMEAAETEAATARRGIWATADAILDTNDAGAMKAADGRFIVATGRVRSVRTVNRITYVNFGPPRSGALTVTIHDRDMPAFRESGLEPAAFRGHMLRVRGTVTIRRSPFIAAAMPEAITIAQAPVRGAR
ncbi:MAG: SNase-like nuclease, partial [Xanthobacteraceae bacterium]